MKNTHMIKSEKDGEYYLFRRADATPGIQAAFETIAQEREQLPPHVLEAFETLENQFARWTCRRLNEEQLREWIAGLVREELIDVLSDIVKDDASAQEIERMSPEQLGELTRRVIQQIGIR